MQAPPPLSHHDVLELVAPFSRHGLQVDMAASDRVARQIAFKPAAVDDGALGPLRQRLLLHSLGTGTCTLTRTVSTSHGHSATLQAMGPDPASLLQAVLAVPAQRHLVPGPGFVLLRSYALDVFAGATPALRLTEGTVVLDGLRCTMVVSRVRNVAAELALVVTRTGPGPALPEDLLAVLGWNWARLVKSRDGWTSRMRLRGAGAVRTERAEAALDKTAAHLACTLADSPGSYHDRHRAARWGVVLRRGIPVLTPLALLLAIALMPRFDPGANPGLALLLYHVPTVLIAGSFCVQELPRFEIPPLPRRSAAASW
jgi:hypothetical protein